MGYEGVLFDFSGTLFHVESAAEALAGALGPEFVGMAPALERFGAINGSDTPKELPDDLAEVWRRRDLSRAAHRAAYSGLSVHAGLTREQADRVYERGTSPAAWHPFPDTVAVLHRLRADGVPVAVVSNIGWDPRPVIAAHRLTDYLPVLVLSDERGVEKPDPAIFELAVRELAVAPERTLMVGDNARTDGGATALGCAFVQVPSAADRSPTALLDAVA